MPSFFASGVPEYPAMCKARPRMVYPGLVIWGRSKPSTNTRCARESQVSLPGVAQTGRVDLAVEFPATARARPGMGAPPRGN